MTSTARPSVQPATPELRVMVLKMRPDWTGQEFDGAIIAARNAGWDWPKTCLEIVRLATDSEASPRDLVKAAQKPILPPKSPPGDYAQGAALARARFEHRRDGEPVSAGEATS